jgi:hypothetical protein
MIRLRIKYWVGMGGREEGKDVQQAGHPISDTAPFGPSSLTSSTFSGSGAHDP